MARYIDAEKVIEIAESNKAVLQSLGDIVDIREIVNDVPTADVQPVKHGKWIDKGNAAGLFCSECDFKVRYRDERRFKYCPNCGAKMERSD